MTPPESNHRLKVRVILWFICLLLLVALGIGLNRLRYDLRSYSLLTHFLHPQDSGPLLRWETHEVQTREIVLPTTGPSVQGRLYLPTGVARPPGMVIVHGIHHLGIDEPRLVSFAQSWPLAVVLRC